MKINAVLAAALGTLCLQSAHAGPADYVYTPTVEQGEKEIDFKYGSESTSPRNSLASLGLGYGVNDWWFTEAYVKYARVSGGGVKFDAFEWENKFQLTEPGEYPVDIGFITEIEVPRLRSEGTELKFGALFQKDIDKLQLNWNVLFEKAFDATPSSDMVMGYQVQAKYRLQPSFEFGAQGLGSMGKWNDWSSSGLQEHRFGPAIFGKFPIGDGMKINYNAAWLFGLTNATPDDTFRLQAELEF